MSSRGAGRIVGVLFMLQLTGLIVPFILLHPLASSDYLTSAASHSVQLKTAVLLFFTNCAIFIATSLTAWPVFRDCSRPMGMWLIILAVILFLLQSVDNVYIMSLLSLSEQRIASPEVHEAIGAAVRATRRAAHYQVLLAIDFWLALFYTILLRFGLVPRVLAAAGLITVIVQFFSVPMPGFLGYGINTNFGLPMALGILVTAVWLIVRGFETKDESQIAG